MINEKMSNEAPNAPLRRAAVIFSFLRNINHYLGKQLQPNKVEKRGNMLYEDCRFDEYKVFICNCTIKQPCTCRSVITTKKLKCKVADWFRKNRILGKS
jgi:hypothetical protein